MIESKEFSEYRHHSLLIPQTLSRAHARLGEAEVALQDILLAELKDHVGIVRYLRAALVQSIEQLGMFRGEVQAQSALMRTHNHLAVQAEHHSVLQRRGEILVARKLVDPLAWDYVVGRLRLGSCHDLLSDFNKAADRLTALTQSLQESVDDLDADGVISNRGLTAVLEGNGIGNIKVLFAALHTEWDGFLPTFRAFNMLSLRVECDEDAGMENAAAA